MSVAGLDPQCHGRLTDLRPACFLPRTLSAGARPTHVGAFCLFVDGFLEIRRGPFQLPTSARSRSACAAQAATCNPVSAEASNIPIRPDWRRRALWPRPTPKNSDPPRGGIVPPGQRRGALCVLVTRGRCVENRLVKIRNCLPATDPDRGWELSLHPHERPHCWPKAAVRLPRGNSARAAAARIPAAAALVEGRNLSSGAG